MLKPETDRLALITNIQQETNRRVQIAALAVEALGGQDAVNGFLKNSLCTLAGIAITEQGPGGACELMADGLMTVEQIAEDLGC
jgi:hypothetical protein